MRFAGCFSSRETPATAMRCWARNSSAASRRLVMQGTVPHAVPARVGGDHGRRQGVHGPVDTVAPPPATARSRTRVTTLFGTP